MPRAQCGPGAKPEPDIQGRVPAGSATNGLWCNVALITHQGTSGGFKVLRYVDPAGHECAYYDTALLFPLNAFNLNSSGLGVVVLDMADPAHPQQTDLLDRAADALAARVADPERRSAACSPRSAATRRPTRASSRSTTCSSDCRHPELQFTRPLARFGHESGFAQDGRTFYATGTATESITAIDVTDTEGPARRSGRATCCRTACRSATTATAPTSPTRPAATC